MKLKFFRKNLFKRYLEIHLNSSSGTIARSLQISFSSLVMIILIVLFFILYTIINILTPYNGLNDREINQYIQNKVSKSIALDSLTVDFINPIQSDLFIISKGLEEDHKGIDIVAEKGTFIRASSIGTILYVGFDKKYGNSILIAHKNNFYTFYGHLDTIFVKSHNLVKQSELIGVVGETGYSTGPHLHFEIWDEWEVKDPRILIEELKGRDVTQ